MRRFILALVKDEWVADDVHTLRKWWIVDYRKYFYSSKSRGYGDIGAESLPRSALSRWLRSGKQIKTLDSFRCLPFGMLHGGEILEISEEETLHWDLLIA